MAESQKPKHWFWNQNSKRWELAGRTKGEVTAFADGNGLGSDKGIRGASTGSFNTVNAANVAVAARLVVGGGTLSLIKKVTGTIPLINVGTSVAAVATITGMGSIGAAVGDLVLPTIKAGLIAGIGLAEAWIPTTNVVNVKLVNPAQDTVGSQPAVGIDLLLVRST